MKVWKSAAGYYFYQDDRGGLYYYDHKITVACLVKECDFLVVKCNEAYYKLSGSNAFCMGKVVDLDAL